MVRRALILTLLVPCLLFASGEQVLVSAAAIFSLLPVILIFLLFPGRELAPRIIAALATLVAYMLLGSAAWMLGFTPSEPLAALIVALAFAVGWIAGRLAARK